MPSRKLSQKLPKGWTLKDIEAVIEYYEKRDGVYHETLAARKLARAK